MKSRILTSVVLLLSLSTPGFAETGKAPDPVAVERGQIIYSNNCQQCHKENGVGENIPGGIRKPNFRAAIPLNEKAHAWHHGDDQLVQIIQTGNTRMPPFKKVLTEPQIRDVIAYMKSLWSPRILGCQGPKHMSCM